MIFKGNIIYRIFFKKGKIYFFSFTVNDSKRWTDKIWINEKREKKKQHIPHLCLLSCFILQPEKKLYQAVQRVPLLCRSYTQNTPRDWACLRLNFQSLGHVPCNIETWPPFRSLAGRTWEIRPGIALRMRKTVFVCSAYFRAFGSYFLILSPLFIYFFPFFVLFLVGLFCFLFLFFKMILWVTCRDLGWLAVFIVDL